MTDDPLQITARRIDQFRRGLKCLIGNARKLPAIISAFAEPLPDLMGHRTSEIGMLEDSGQ